MRVHCFLLTSDSLISYWYTSYTDNNVGDHPGAGEILPVDAGMALRHAPDGSILRPRTLAYDAAFSTSKSSPQTIHYQGAPVKLRGQPGQSVFDDTLDWWFPRRRAQQRWAHRALPARWYSVDVPKTRTTIRVVKVNKLGVMTVKVTRAN